MGMISQEEKIKKSDKDSCQFFEQMKEFIGFTDDDANTIKESGRLIEKHIPNIVTAFYMQLLRYPPTRKYFLKDDGTVDQDYLKIRMEHQAKFWLRTASGVYDEEYARYVDYVGRAHTSQGADPDIYIPARYVIGQVGFIQHAITSALINELNDYDIDLKNRAIRAWNMLMMVILEMLSRVYEKDPEHLTHDNYKNIDQNSIEQMAVEAFESGLGITRTKLTRDILVGKVSDIPDGERRIIKTGELSIGIFHHRGGWYAIRNRCLHQGGPIAEGCLEGDVLECPSHGFQYRLTSGALLVDPSVRLEMFPVILQGEEIYLRIPEPVQADSE
jgi:nitrite reductase/ring-hydroxylating ferredoxin subunit